ncbi:MULTISPECIES: FtsB family cell division protein [Kaistia]|uniref:Septum formation initiator family protein n=1 Tax=Kaistia nematophila TaxID=2994654 RepID=A0A9X3IL53_9HYPH|nr:septum formation initiator family protein [Kaistia nematophila]MCX5568490.1 septum formation initiator family protein [Kaistia nematophila]
MAAIGKGVSAWDPPEESGAYPASTSFSSRRRRGDHGRKPGVNRLAPCFIHHVAPRSDPRMTTKQRKHSKLRRLILPLGSLAVMGYFAYHSFNGDYGIWSRERMEREAIGLEKELAEMKAERLSLAARAQLLRPESLDPDMIDERARAKLNVVQADELVIGIAASQ